jgi:hypothetical protein
VDGFFGDQLLVVAAQVIWLGIVSTGRGLEKQKEKKKTCQITPLELREEKEKNIFLGG